MVNRDAQSRATARSNPNPAQAILADSPWPSQESEAIANWVDLSSLDDEETATCGPCSPRGPAAAGEEPWPGGPDSARCGTASCRAPGDRTAAAAPLPADGTFLIQRGCGRRHRLRARPAASPTVPTPSGTGRRLPHPPRGLL
ncbi:hypothetical protein GCM10023238_39370 [Streptomyces heliomycini]